MSRRFPWARRRYWHLRVFQQRWARGWEDVCCHECDPKGRLVHAFSRAREFDAFARAHAINQPDVPRRLITRRMPLPRPYPLYGIQPTWPRRPIFTPDPVRRRGLADAG